MGAHALCHKGELMRFLPSFVGFVFLVSAIAKVIHFRDTAGFVAAVLDQSPAVSKTLLVVLIMLELLLSFPLMTGLSDSIGLLRVILASGPVQFVLVLPVERRIRPLCLLWNEFTSPSGFCDRQEPDTDGGPGRDLEKCQACTNSQLKRWRKMKKKLIVPGVFASLFVALTAWLYIEATRPEVLPMGSSLPELPYETAAGVKILAPGNNNILVLFFHRNCEYCQYELQEFSENLPALAGFDLKLLTTDREVFETKYPEQWPVLASADNVEWGIVDRAEFLHMFGETATPVTFLFRKNVLCKKIRGEAKLAYLLITVNGA